MEQQEKYNLLPIGKMAKANRVTIATLRLYDEMDLLTPTYTDPETGYRYYDIRQTSRLDFIRYIWRQYSNSGQRHVRLYLSGPF